MQCPECGAIASENDLFCGECGAVLSAPPAQPTDGPVVEMQVETPVAPVPSSPAPYQQPPTPTPYQQTPTPAPYQQPPSPPSYAPTIRDSRANTAFILGIVSIALIALSCVPIVSWLSCLQPFAAVAAIVLGAIAKRDIQAKGGLEEDRKKAHRGMIMGIVGLALVAILIVIAVAGVLSLGVLEELQTY